MVFIRKTKDYLLHLGAQEETFNTAHALRNSMTEAEKTLWHELKNRKLQGLKFRRQHPIHWYVADFYCHEKRLVIEVDGGIHMNTKFKEHYDIKNHKHENIFIHHTDVRYFSTEFQSNMGSCGSKMELQP